jgi:hypothetical protein
MISDPSAAERAYQRLKTDILTGVLATGPLDIRELGDCLKMSVTPVREALARLSAERLVKLAPHQGYVVANPSARRLRNLYDLSGALVDLTIQRCEASLSSSPRPGGARKSDYAQDLADLMLSMATSQPNGELGEHLLALSDRLFPARRCEPSLFPEALEELDLLAILWAQRNLDELRLRFNQHHAARMERTESIASLLTERAGDQ